MCTTAAARSRRLKPGQQTEIDVTFYTEVDGPGKHGEVVRLVTDDRQATKRAERFPLASEIAFYITTDATPGG